MGVRSCVQGGRDWLLLLIQLSAVRAAVAYAGSAEDHAELDLTITSLPFRYILH